jgi:hypothetical protein
MLTNVPKNSSSVRVVFFFLAFVGVCVYTPVLIDDLIQGRGSAQQRITQGEDPSTVLEHTGAGQVLDAGKCNSTDYVYGRSLHGRMFVTKANNSLYAVNVDGAVEFFLLDDKGVVVPDSGNADSKADIGGELSSVLADCIESEAVPASVDISFNITP